MKKQATKYLLSLWFALLLIVGNTPMDFIHQFADHKDTIHREHKGLVIEKKHHHCAYLSLTLTCFSNDFSIPVIHLSVPGHFTPYGGFYTCTFQRTVTDITPRGPPQV